MAENIRVNHERIRREAEQLKGASAYLKNMPLPVMDVRTTLPANINGRRAYEQGQKNLAKLGRALEHEAENIEGLNLAFAEFDKMAGELGRGGMFCDEK